MDQVKHFLTSRKDTGIRFLYSLLFLVVFEIIKVIVEVAFVFQMIYMLITRRPSEPVRKFSNKVSTYGYRVMRFLTMNDNRTPFPFADFPNEMEPPESSY